MYTHTYFVLIVRLLPSPVEWTTLYTQISVLRNQEIRRHVPFLNWNPHTKYMGPDPNTKSMTHTNCAEFLMTEI